MSALRRLAVYCGSASGATPRYAESARALARAMAAREIDLVYGGAKVGVMGVLADAVMAAGRRVCGVIPRNLVEREVAHRGIHELRIVETMHERKALMADLADGFVALPGGLGTMDELFEVWTWSQLGLHAKPIGLLDVDGYYGPLLAFLERSVAEGFVRREHRDLLRVADAPEVLLDRLFDRE
jgi:uncharacterized protein (TIGR00730 family)